MEGWRERGRKREGGRERGRERGTEGQRERGRGRGDSDSVSAICSKYLCCYESAAVAGNSRRLSSVLVTGRKLLD